MRYVLVNDMPPHEPSSLPEGVQVWIDGIAKVPENAHVSVFDRGFLYGDSVFETLRTYGGKAFALDEHMERLSESAKRVFIEIPLPQEDFGQEVERAISASSFSDCYVRVMVTRGRGALGLDPRAAVTPLRVVLVAPLSAPPLSDYRDGIRVISFETTRATDDIPAAGAKIGNYLVAVLAHKKAAETGAKEALVVNPRGEVTEGATSNVFWIEDDLLLTPPLSAGILDGITRRHILRAARRLNVPVREEVPTIKRLATATGVFVSSSIREMLPVTALDDLSIQEGRVPEMFRALHAEFRRSAGVEPLLFS